VDDHTLTLRTGREIQALFRISKGTLCNWVARGAPRYGGGPVAPRYSVPELRAWLRRHAHRARRRA